MRRVLDDSPEVNLIDMDWNEHWADVTFVDDSFSVSQLQFRLIPAGAWCDLWSAGSRGVMG